MIVLGLLRFECKLGQAAASGLVSFELNTDTIPEYYTKIFYLVPFLRSTTVFAVDGWQNLDRT